MTTPPNHNTADQSGAMQPTSSASSADELAELIRQIDGNHDMGAGALAEALLPHLAAIVPQVVQAPKKLADLIVALSLRVAEQPSCKSDVDLVKEADAALKVLAAPIVATPKLTECRHCGFMVALNQAPADAAPIVATVPSEPVAWMAESCGEVAVHKERLPFAANWKPLYAAPSPTEQASDVRDAALEEVIAICDDYYDKQLPMMKAGNQCVNYLCGYDDACGDLGHVFRALKSAPAAKGNAQDEVKETYTTGHCEHNNQPGGCQQHNLHCGWPKCDQKEIK